MQVMMKHCFRSLMIWTLCLCLRTCFAIHPKSCSWHVPPAVEDDAKLSQMIWKNNAKANALGAEISKEDTARVRATEGGDDVATPPDFMGEACTADAYGEITLKGAEDLMKHPNIDLQQSDTFYDLGAGFGRLALMAATQIGTHRAIGVELSVDRVNHGCALVDKLKKEFHEEAAVAKACEFELRQGDLLKQDLSDASVVYVANLCFPPGLQNATLQKFVTDLRTGTRLAALQPFFGSDRLELVATQACEMTWDKQQQVYLYKVVEGASIIQPQTKDTEKWGNGTAKSVALHKQSNTQQRNSSGGTGFARDKSDGKRGSSVLPSTNEQIDLNSKQDPCSGCSDAQVVQHQKCMVEMTNNPCTKLYTGVAFDKDCCVMKDKHARCLMCKSQGARPHYNSKWTDQMHLGVTVSEPQ